MTGRVKSILAVDIDARELRTAMSERIGGQWTAVRTRSTPLPHGEGQSEERHGALRTALREAYRDTAAGAPTVLTALPKGRTFIRVIETPKVGRKQLREILKMRVATEIPRFSEESVIWDFEIIEERPGDSTLRVVLCAVRREVLDEFLADFHSAGIVPRVIDLEPLALARWFLDRRKDDVPADIALVDPSDANTAIVTIAEGRPVEFTQTPITVSELPPANARGAERFIVEMQSALGSTAEGRERPTPRKIVFCGDPATAAALAEPVRDQMKMEIALLSECVSTAKDRPSIPAGQLGASNRILESLLHRALVKKPGLANLAAKRIANPRLRAFATRASALPVLIPATAVLLLVFIFGSQQLRASRLASLESAIEAVEPIAPRLAQMDGTLKVLETYEKERYNWLDAFEELTAIMPKNITLNQLTLERKGHAILQGVVKDKQGAQVVEAFAAKLEESELFANAQPGAIRMKKDKEWTFKITCDVTGKKKKGK